MCHNYSKTDQVMAVNDTLLMAFMREEMVYTMIDMAVNIDYTTNYPVKFPLILLSMPYYRLIRSTGTSVMLLQNLKPSKLCNGTRMKVKAFFRNIAEATILNGCAQRESVFVSRILLILNDPMFKITRL